MIEQIDHTAVISNSDDWDESSPGDEVLDTLSEEDVGTYWTAEHGDVLFLVDEEGDLKYVAEHNDGDELNDAEPPDAAEFSVTGALDPLIPDPLSVGADTLVAGDA